MVSIANEIFDDQNDFTSSIVKIGIDKTPGEFHVDTIVHDVSKILNTKARLQVMRIQKEPLTIDVKVSSPDESTNNGGIILKAIYHQMTDQVLEAFGRMSIFFFFIGSPKSFQKTLEHRTEITLNSAFNRCYCENHSFWTGSLHDGKNRGDAPYFCPIGWKRYSFFVTENFDAKFNGWCICYHGTKLQHALSILLSGLKPANDIAHGAGIYCSPSIIYTAHPRYAEVVKVKPDQGTRFFAADTYVQFVLECRVKPSMRKKKPETLGIDDYPIDPNIGNHEIEWVINHQGKSIADFNDPDSPIVCTGVMIRSTNNHPGLLPESEWWFHSTLRKEKSWASFETTLSHLECEMARGITCEIIHY